MLYLRLGHLFDKLARVSRERFDIAALSFGINSFKGKRRFTGTRGSCTEGDFTARDGGIDFLQVILRGALDGDMGDRRKRRGSLVL
jgi:hypothetical protein